MAAHWWWTWSVGLPVDIYAKSLWGPSSQDPALVSTNNATNLNSPNPGSGAPGEEYNLKVFGQSFILTPPFQNGVVTKGWIIFRWNGDNHALDISSGTRIIEVMHGGVTTVIRLAAATSTTPAALNLFVNGTLVGTSGNTFGDVTEVLAIDFDLTTTPPEAGLVVSGVREIARAGGSGTPTDIDRLKIGSGQTSNYSYLGDPIVFNDLADVSVSDTQDVWVTYLIPDLVTDGDASWTPVGGTTTSVLADRDAATYNETTTGPDNLDLTFESTSDRYATWFPVLIYGVATVAYGVADVIHNTTIEMFDDVGSVSSTNDTLNAVGRFIGTWSALNSSAAPWTLFNLNSVTATYTVST